MRSALVAVTLGVGGCADDSDDGGPRGTLRVLSSGELAEGGIETNDGWNVEITSLKATISEFQLGALSLSGRKEMALLDSTGSTQLFGEGELKAGRYTGASFTIERLQVIGTGRKEGRESRFDWTFDDATRYVRCANQTEVPVDGGVGLTITVHPAELFRSSLISAGSALSFQAIADADSDADGQVLGDELWARTVGSYTLGDHTNVTSLWEFIEELATQLVYIDDGLPCETDGP